MHDFDQTKAFPPRLILIGAQKAGTTTLVHLLTRHPDIEAGTEKEPDFYTRFFDRGLGWYRDNFESLDAKWLIDASTAYSAGYVDDATGRPFTVAERIKATVDQAKLVYLLRDPVGRAYSSYWHERRYSTERRPLREAITPDSVYVRQGRYVDHVDYYRAHFPAEDLLILDFGELKKDPKPVLAAVTEFLGLPPVPDAPETGGGTKNAGFQYSGLAYVAMKLFPSERAFRATLSKAKGLAPNFIKKYAMAALTKDIPPLSDEDRAWLAALFEPHTRRLEERLGRSFAHWTRSTTIDEAPVAPIYPETAAATNP